MLRLVLRVVLRSAFGLSAGCLWVFEQPRFASFPAASPAHQKTPVLSHVAAFVRLAYASRVSFVPAVTGVFGVRVSSAF